MNDVEWLENDDDILFVTRNAIVVFLSRKEVIYFWKLFLAQRTFHLLMWCRAAILYKRSWEEAPLNTMELTSK